MEAIKLETACGTNNKTRYPLMHMGIFFVCMCGIEYNFVRFDSSTEKAYQINDGLDDTLQDKRSLQRAVSNRRRHWKRIQWQLKGRRYFELDCSAGSVCDWILNLNIVGLMILQQQQQKTYQINNWMILYTRGDAFNRWY